MTRRLAIVLSVLTSLALAQDPPPFAPQPQPPPTPSADPAKPPADPAKPPADPAKPPADPAKPAAGLPKPPADPVTPPRFLPDPPVDPAKPAAAPAKPQVEKLSETKYRIGTITIDQKTREIRFPGKVNMNKGLLEYLLCQQQGKVHEALLITETSPTFLSLAFTLLRYPPSNEMFSLIDETGHQTGIYPNVPPAVKAGARIAIEVEWKTDDDKTHRLPVNDWIQHSVKNTAMKSGPWLYTGSDFYEGKFIPEMTGDIAAIMTVPSAMINFPGPENDDNVWFGYEKRVPPVGTPITVIITPFSNTRPLPKP